MPFHSLTEKLILYHFSKTVVADRNDNVVEIRDNNGREYKYKVAILIYTGQVSLSRCLIYVEMAHGSTQVLVNKITQSSILTR